MAVTEITFDPRIDLPSGALGVFNVTVRATPTRIRDIGNTTVYPQTVQFQNVTADTPFALQSTDGTWAWLIGVYQRQKILDIRTVFVTGATANWGALVDVDPATLEPVPQFSTVGAQLAAIDARLTALRTEILNGAPGQLDTLNELAAALGDDANFAATVTNNIAGKLSKSANLSDLLSAAAARTNLGLGTSATQAASAFDAAGAAVAAAAPKSTSLTVAATQTAAYTAASNELIPVDASGAAVVVTLPSAPPSASRVTIKKIDSSTNAVTIARNGTDVFNKTGGSTTLTLSLQNQSATVQYASGIWYVTGGDLPLSSLQTSLSATYSTLDLVLSQPTTAFIASGTLVAGGPNTVDATSAAVTLALPAPTKRGQLLPVERLDASTNAVTVAAATGAAIRGNSTATITMSGVGAAYEALLFVAESSSSWRPISGHKTKAWLDKVYAPVPILYNYTTTTYPARPSSATLPNGQANYYGPVQPSDMLSNDIWNDTSSTISIRGNTAAGWAAANTVLAAREPGLETDTLLVKYGDGATAWNALSYSGSSTSSATPTLAWWRASDIKGLTDGAAVASWTDSSGNGKTASQATTSRRPIYKAGVLNGEPVVRFDGTAFQGLITAATIPVLIPFTFTAVLMMTSVTTAQDFLAAGANSGLEMANKTSGGLQANQRGTVSIGAQTSGTITSGTYRVISFTYDGTNWTWYIDGLQRATGTSVGTTSLAAAVYQIGCRDTSTSPFTGDIAEIQLWGQAQSTTARHANEVVLGKRYGITIT